jgi:hypothetical protein
VVDELLFGGESLLAYLSHPNFHFVKADVCEPRAIRSAIREDWPKPDAVVHLAAIVGFPACQAVGRQVAWRYNVEATQRVFEQAEALGTQRFVYASTYSNYGLSPDGQPVTEESVLTPQSLYAETKIAAERFLLGQRASTCAPLIFRQATLFGISPRTRFDLIINQFVLEAYTRRELLIYQRGLAPSFIQTHGFCVWFAGPCEMVRARSSTQPDWHLPKMRSHLVLQRLPETVAAIRQTRRRYARISFLPKGARAPLRDRLTAEDGVRAGVARCAAG